MITKLPKWVWFASWALAFVAGTVNVVGLLSFEHRAITHLTGNTSMLAAALASFDTSAIIDLLLVMGSFVIGCAISGFIVQDAALRLGRRYGVALSLESILLFSAAGLLDRQNSFGLYAAAAACGIQNAMASTYSGTVVRTTHVSGMFTDLGISLGHILRGLPIDGRRIRLCVSVISGFLVGGIVGALAFRSFGCLSLLIPAVLTAVASLKYATSRRRKFKICNGSQGENS